MVSRYIKNSTEHASWIRKMFEEGNTLKQQFGPENVFDFSIGNPDVDPPPVFHKRLADLVNDNTKGIHGYMPNAGFIHVKKAIAEKVNKDHDVSIDPDHIIMTCGAAGGLNIILKTILDPGDEVIVLKPYFVEYGFYINNHQGSMVLVETNEDFSINLQNIRQAVTEKTKAILINSPNNPTGKIYSEHDIKALAALLSEYNSAERIIYLIADEPYREIVYDNNTVPSILKHYNESLVVTSYSKTLSIPGERIGYVAVNSKATFVDSIVTGLVFSNRILGFVNAPALMQRVVAGLNDVAVDVMNYQHRRDLFVAGLAQAGYFISKPEGTFYLFCKSPVADDVAFARHLLKYNILVVPGTGFGCPGYFRIAYCVSPGIIERAIPKFAEALRSIS